MHNKKDFTLLAVHIRHQYFLKDTGKAYCFLLWNKRFVNFPKSIIKDYQHDKEKHLHLFKVPLWHIIQNRLDSIVDDDYKELLPTNEKKRSRRPKDTLTPDMFAELTAEPSPTKNNLVIAVQRQAEMEEQGKQNIDTAIELIDGLDDEIPW